MICREIMISPLLVYRDIFVCYILPLNPVAKGQAVIWVYWYDSYMVREEAMIIEELTSWQSKGMCIRDFRLVSGLEIILVILYAWKASGVQVRLQT